MTTGKTPRTRVALAVIVAAVLAAAGLFYARAGHDHGHASRSGPHGDVGAAVSSESNAACRSGGAAPLKQALDGKISGCLSLPADPPGRYTVSLSTIVIDGGSVATPSVPTSTTQGPGAGSGAVGSLIAKPSAGPPGTRITLSGHYQGQASNGPGSYADACWNGCPDGLMEDGVPISWGPGGRFSTTVVVPETAWLDGGAVHPLVSGTYQVGLECLVPQTRGCGTRSAQASVAFHLIAPAPLRCVSGRPCAQLHLNPAHGVAGDSLSVSGWAPLSTIIGQPFGYQTDITSGSGSHLGDRPLKADAGELTVAETPVRIDAPPSWADLDGASQLWTQTAGTTLIGAAPGNALRLGYCGAGEIEVSSDGGTTFTAVATSGIRAALAATPYQLGSPGSPSCSDIALDPTDPATVYAAVAVNPYGQAPPFEAVGLVSTDRGADWSLIPAPPGAAADDFSDFRADAAGVDAVFNPPLEAQPGPGPQGTGQPVLVERTTDGGRSWSSAPLTCPTTGPCVTLGGYSIDNCDMSATPQELLYSTNGGATWNQPSWPATVDACAYAQVTALTDSTLVLVDPGSGYLLLRSQDGGRRWSYIGVPAAPGQSAGQQDALGGITLLPNGDLLSTAGSGSTTGGKWYLLPTGRNSWCEVDSGTSLDPSSSDGPVTAIGSRLWWLQVAYGPTSSSTSLKSVRLASFRCGRNQRA